MEYSNKRVVEMPIIKRLLLAKVLPITKDTPYVKALKVAALIFMLPEALIIATLPFEVFSPNEVALISLFFCGLALVMPLAMRLSEKKLVALLLMFTVSCVLIAVLQSAGDAYYVKRVVSAYLDGADYSKEEDRWQWVGSSCARSYARFFIGECDFLKKCGEDMMVASQMSQAERGEWLNRLRKSVLLWASELDARFQKTGYCNSATTAGVEVVHRNYEKVMSCLDMKVKELYLTEQKIKETPVKSSDFIELGTEGQDPNGGVTVVE